MVKIGGKRLGLEDFYRILYKGEKIKLDEKALADVGHCFEFLKEFSKDKIIYGINTGFGPMAQYRINEADQQKLQYNLIRSHSSGQGAVLDADCLKAVVISRLNTLLLAHSGVHVDTILLLRDLANANILPHIYEHGGVGASGDLVQLAHLALAMIGEGYVDVKGKKIVAKIALEKSKIDPLKIYLREGLALMNGTSCMSGIGVVNLIKAKKLFNWSVLASSMVNELVGSYDDHFSKELNQSKLHPGQRKVARYMTSTLADSQMVRRRNEHLYDPSVKETVFKEKVQEYYSLRCVPQILGPILDTLEYAENVIINEINSANDNPIVDVETRNVYHGGNFHGDYVALEMDKVKIAMTKLSMLAERQLNYLMNHKLNEKLPPFINLGTLGLNFGLQGMQFPAVSTTAENQTLSFPMYVHSIPNNNDNQDMVSMGSNAALLTGKVIENTAQVLAVQFIAIAQAVDYLKCQDLLSNKSLETYHLVRHLIDEFVDDEPQFEKINDVKTLLLKSEFSHFTFEETKA